MSPETPKQVDLLVHGAAEVCTPLGDAPLGGADLGRVERIADGAVAVDRGRIVAVGPREELVRAYRARTTVDAAGGIVLPGFVDAHTHPVFAGTREAEFEARNAGRSYEEIARAGGGIVSTVSGVRAASAEQLAAMLLPRLDRFLELGTTTVECKSGYGLELEAELASLRAIAAADGAHPVRCVATFLGAHALPPEYADDRAGYVRLVTDEMLPRVVEEGLARFADVFTERVAFDAGETRAICARATELGLGIRLHVDQLSDGGGAALAAELGAASADHLEHVSEAGIAALAEARVQPVLCPVVPLFLRESKEAPGRRLVAAGLAPAISTDFNPGSCYLQSMPEVVSWSALRYGFSAAECLTAATLNAAATLGLADELGSLEPGKRADLIVCDIPNLEHLAYELGRNPVRAVVVSGEVVQEAGA